jgi:membrane-associated protease RseP (regulator of RpoE activity)
MTCDPCCDPDDPCGDPCDPCCGPCWWPCGWICGYCELDIVIVAEAEAVEGTGALTWAVYGVEILEELDGGVAAACGLEVGDIILNYNGTPTPTFAALQSAVQAGGPTVSVLVLRDDGGELETVTLTPVNGLIGVTGQSVRVEDLE